MTDKTQPEGDKADDIDLPPRSERTINEGRKELEMVEVHSPDPASRAQELAKQVQACLEEHQIEKKSGPSQRMSYMELTSRESKRVELMLLMIGMVGSFLFGGAMPIFCLVMGGLINDVGEKITTAGPSLDQLRDQAIMMIYIGVGTWVVSFFQMGFLMMFEERLAFKLKILYFRRCLEQDASYYDEHNPNEMASRISNEVGQIQRGIGDRAGQLLNSVSAFFLGFILAFYQGWELTLIICIALPFLAGAIGWFFYLVQAGVWVIMKSYAQSAGYAEQALHAIKVVQTYGNEILETLNYEKYLDRSRDVQQAEKTKTAFARSFMFFMIYIFYAHALYFGGVLRARADNEGSEAEEEGYSGGSIIAIVFTILIAGFRGANGTNHQKAVTDAQIAGKLAYEVIDHVAKVNPNEAGTQDVNPKEHKGQIEFKNVSFTYPTRQEFKALKNFSCTFEAGKTTALVGPSGSGKSTIVQLIERFYDPESGQISLDGKNTRSLNLRQMRQMIGYVGQEPVLFNTTIKENMLFAKPDATDQEIEDALKAANAWYFISTKMGSGGIHTHVGGVGGKLSGGQKQRIAIARAFLKKPTILLLDEATSALDRVNEKAIQDAIDRYRESQGNISIIVIAHRLSTVRDADKIVVMKNGSLVETGTHDSLLNEFPGGVYAGFVEKQMKAEANSPAAEDPLEDPEPIPQPELIKKKSVTKTVSENGQVRQVEISEREAEVTKEVDAVDKEYDAGLAELQKKQAEVSSYRKIWPYNKPRIYVFLAIIGSLLNGAVQPIFGIILSKMLSTLTVPVHYWSVYFGEDDSIEDTVKRYVLLILALAFGALGCGFVQKYSFGTLGANVTEKLRRVLYLRILEKDMGWFDNRDHGTSVLTSAMAHDPSLVNGASTESLGPLVEANCAMFLGIGVGFYYCWQEALTCLICSPILIIGQVIKSKMTHKQTLVTNDLLQDSDLLCGDSIANFKTVQSFGHDEMFVKKYASMIEPITRYNLKNHLMSGMAFGFSQFTTYLIFAVLFYAGGVIIENSQEPGSTPVNPEDVFTALFAIFFAAQQSGQATAFAPDIGKAQAAVDRIFKFMEYPSKINAIAMDEDKSKKRIASPEEVRGEIEFRDVWFRYPTRKEDFVLRGLTIKINVKEKVALVGESGCGKSTFVNLLMRFYDVDKGEVLLDGVNVKDYNLHDLRKAVSLVMQEPIIFNYSILENILYGKLDAKNSEVKLASDISNSSEFILHSDFQDFDNSADSLVKAMNLHRKELIALIGEAKFNEELEAMHEVQKAEEKKGFFQAIVGDVDRRPDSLKDVPLHDGFSTQCGIRGGKLSGGQKQRVAIARTIIREPKVLILDEATSALDEDNQKLVQEALDQAMEGRTTIIIAHRLSTIQNCNKVFVLEEGKVSEEGSFNELKEKGGYLAKIGQQGN